MDADIRRLGCRLTTRDVVHAYGSDAVVERVAWLRANGYPYAAKTVERELNQILRPSAARAPGWLRCGGSQSPGAVSCSD